MTDNQDLLSCNSVTNRSNQSVYILIRHDHLTSTKTLKPFTFMTSESPGEFMDLTVSSDVGPVEDTRFDSEWDESWERK